LPADSLPPAPALARLDISDLPLVTESSRHSRGVDEEARFQFGRDALLHGYARWQERDQEPIRPWPAAGQRHGGRSG
jgi:hypothetical protein